MSTHEQGFAELQMLVMEHEQVIEQYSDLLRDQQGQMDRLHKRIELLEQKLSKYEEPGESTHHNELPPHY